MDTVLESRRFLRLRSLLDGALSDVKVFLDDGEVVLCDGLLTRLVAPRLGGDDHLKVSL